MYTGLEKSNLFFFATVSDYLLPKLSTTDISRLLPDLGLASCGVKARFSTYLSGRHISLEVQSAILYFTCDQLRGVTGF